MSPVEMHPAAEQELGEIAELYEAIGQDLASTPIDERFPSSSCKPEA